MRPMSDGIKIATQMGEGYRARLYARICWDLNMFYDIYVFLVDGPNGEFIDYAACS